MTLKQTMQTPNDGTIQLTTSPEAPISGGVHGTEKLQQIIAMLSNLSPADTALIERAYAVADKWHTGQPRASKQPYITHPLAVAAILAEMDMDAATICAALLHDTVEDSAYTIHELEDDFTREVAQLVYGVTKMSAITDKAQIKTEEEI
jgi:GTP pyrophosphokinase